MKKIALAAGLGLVLIGSTLFLRTSKEVVQKGESPSARSFTPLPLPSAETLSEKPQEKPSRAKLQNSKDSWNAFQSRYGKHLKPEFSETGKLVSVHGEFGQGSPGPRGFKPDHSQMAILRAREIVTAASELLGIQQEWPLDQAQARGSKLSAQVFFSQSYQGIIVRPSGTVRVNLGPKGELVDLYSNYADDLKLVNHVVIPIEEAKSKVIEAFQGPDQKPLHILGGNRVIWVSGKDAFFAYDFVASGHQIVVNAQDGKILDTRDIRQN